MKQYKSQSFKPFFSGRKLVTKVIFNPFRDQKFHLIGTLENISLQSQNFFQYLGKTTEKLNENDNMCRTRCKRDFHKIGYNYFLVTLKLILSEA